MRSTCSLRANDDSETEIDEEDDSSDAHERVAVAISQPKARLQCLARAQFRTVVRGAGKSHQEHIACAIWFASALAKHCRQHGTLCAAAAGWCERLEDIFVLVEKCHLHILVPG